MHPKQKPAEDLTHLDDLIQYNKGVITAEENRIEEQKSIISELGKARIVDAQAIFSAEARIKEIQHRIDFKKQEIENYSKQKEGSSISSL